jgi:hypothetical protein
VAKYKNQHTITRAYLEGFTPAESPQTLWRFDKRDGTCERRSVDRATVRFYAFSFRERDGTWNHQVEAILSKIESESLPILRQLQKRDVELSPKEKSDVALFIATLMRRPAALLDLFKEEMTRFVGNRKHQHAIIDQISAHNTREFTPEEIAQARQLVDEGYFDRSLDEAKAHHMQVWLRTWPKYVACLTDMYWQVLKSTCYDFVTSDAPVFVRRHAHDEDEFYIGLGQTDVEVELNFPISRTHFLIARYTPLKPRVNATKTRVRELNARVMRMAHRYVFAQDGGLETKARFERNRGFVSPLPDFSGVRSKVAKKYGLPPGTL